MLANSRKDRFVRTRLVDGCSTVLDAISMPKMGGYSVGHPMQHGTLVKADQETLRLLLGTHNHRSYLTGVQELYRLKTRDSREGPFSVVGICHWVCGCTIHAVVLDQDDERVYTTIRTYRKLENKTYLA